MTTNSKCREYKLKTQKPTCACGHNMHLHDAQWMIWWSYGKCDYCTCDGYEADEQTKQAKKDGTLTP